MKRTVSLKTYPCGTIVLEVITVPVEAPTVETRERELVAA